MSLTFIFIKSKYLESNFIFKHSCKQGIILLPIYAAGHYFNFFFHY